MLYLFSIAIGFQLDRYELVYSGQSGIFQGVSYATPTRSSWHSTS